MTNYTATIEFEIDQSIEGLADLNIQGAAGEAERIADEVPEGNTDVEQATVKKVEKVEADDND